MQGHPIARTVVWIGGFALIWWGLAGPDGGGWHVGVIGVAAATLALALLSTRWGPSISPLGLALFVPFFLLRAFRGGVDVSSRAISRGPRIEPALLRYRIRLPAGAPTTLFVNSITLMPGTFSAQLEADEVTVHLLASNPRDRTRLAELEDRVGAVFGLRPSGARE